MSNFISKWIRCNVCFQGFEGGSGMLTSCGHFVCSRPDCQISCPPGTRTTCPVCRASCGAVSLADTLPSEVLQFFESPDTLIRRALDVMRFHDHQKELSREHFAQNAKRISELEAQVAQLRAEKKELQASLGSKGKKTRQPVQSELMIPGIIKGKKPKVETPEPEEKKELFRVAADTKSAPNEPIAKLFTPTLASRLQNLTGKKIHDPV